MAVDVRWSTGIDTCLLQAADSFWRLMAFRAGRGAEGSYGAPDPAARQQFIEAVDIYCDSPAIRLVLPIHQMGHLGRIGKLVAGEATPLVGAIETCRFRDDRGTELYRHFISLIRSNSGFRERAIAWAWFQFLDPDVLLGYAGRMGVAKDVKFLKDNMRLEFATALRHLQGSEVHSAVRSAKEQSTALHHSPNELSALITRLRGEDIEDLQQAGELAEYLSLEIDECGDLWSDFVTDDTDKFALYLLAYAGSVARRGFQYAEAYTRDPSNSVVYVPHHMRGDFFQKTVSALPGEIDFGSTERIYWWSYGSLALAVETFPTRWTLDRLLTKMQAIRTKLKWQAISISIDRNISTTSPIFEPEEYHALESIAQEENLVTPEYTEHLLRRKQLVAAHCRLLPMLAFGGLAEAASTWLNNPLPSGLAALIGAYLTFRVDSRLGDKIEGSALAPTEWAEEHWLILKQMRGKVFESDSENPIGPIAVKGSWSARRMERR